MALNQVFDPRAGRSTLILFATFAIVASLAILGTFLDHVWKVDTNLILEAMRIVGLSGPAGTAIQSGAEIYGKVRMQNTQQNQQQNTQQNTQQPVPSKPSLADDPRWAKK